MKPSERIQFQEEALTELIAGTSLDQLSNPTPCAKWNTSDLMNHLVGGATLIGSAMGGEPLEVDPEGPMPDMVGDDPSGAWGRALEVFNAGADSPGALERPIELPLGTLPGAVIMDMLSFDLLVHAWDLAQATGQSFDPPADVVEPATQVAHQLLAPELRDGDTFAAEVTPPSDATPIQRLAAFTGRAV